MLKLSKKYMVKLTVFNCIGQNFKRELSDLLKVETIYKTMLKQHWLKCRKNTETKNLKVVKIKTW